jgi:hypothetical protein
MSPWEHRDDVFDHADRFRIGRRQVAAAVHLYHPLAIDRLPTSTVVDQLPASWYYPQLTTAYAYRSAAPAYEGVE